MTEHQQELLKHPENKVRDCIYANLPHKGMYQSLGKMERAIQHLVKAMLEAKDAERRL